MIDAIGIFRERRFSPGKVQDDAAILERTAEHLRESGATVKLVAGEEASAIGESRLVFAMCQGPDALAALDRLRCPVVNAPAAIRNCFRVNLVERLAAGGVPQPRWAHAGGLFPRDLGAGPWLKRGDVHAMEAADVRRIFREEEWGAAIEDLRRRGVPRAIVQEHREGEVYKFYGVTGGFFRAFGLPVGREPEAATLAEAGARALGLSVYGGDGVCAADGSLTLIDFNDWPSFSRCREAAAVTIASHLKTILNGKTSDDTEN